MIIAITEAGALELRDADNFRDFKIVVERANADQAFIGSALAGVASMDPDGKHAWVSQAALKHWQGREQAPEWIASFDKMVNAVRKFGWIDDARGTVRGHIEGAPPLCATPAP